MSQLYFHAGEKKTKLIFLILLLKNKILEVAGDGHDLPLPKGTHMCIEGTMINRTSDFRF